MVVALVDDGALLVLLRIEVSREGRVSSSIGVWQPHVGKPATGKLVDFPAVILDPGTRPQAVLVGNGDNGNEPGPFEFRSTVQPNHSLTAGGSLKRRIHIRRWGNRLAVDLQEIVADRHAHSGRAQGSAQIRIPILSGIDSLDSIVSVLQRVVGTQQTHRYRRVGRLVSPAAEIRVADDELSARLRNEICEIRAMSHVWHHWLILREDCLPVSAVHLGVVEEVALRAPRLAEDLGPLGGRVDEHLQLRNVERAIADLRGTLRRHNPPGCGRSCTGRIEHFLRVRRETVGANALEERGCRPLLQLVTLQPERTVGCTGDRFGIEERTRRSGGEAVQLA